MGNKTVEQIIGFEAMLGAVEAVRNGVPTDLLPQQLFTITRPIEGEKGEYTRVDGTRETARRAEYGSPSERRKLQGISTQLVALIHSFEHIMHNPHVLTLLRQVDNPMRQSRGEQEIDRQTAIFLQRFLNLRISTVASIFAQGTISFDGAGNLLPDTSGAALTIDFDVPAGHKNQLDVEGTGDLITASWAVATTPIISNIKSIKNVALRETGYPLRHAFYGDNILQYLINNAEVDKLLQANQTLSAGFTAMEIPMGFMELTWWSTGGQFFADAAGVNQTFFDDDSVVFLPDPDPTWWEILEGTYNVPTALGNVSQDGGAAMADVTEVNGLFNYAKLNDDPVTVKHLAGDTMLPVLKVPKAIYIADVTP